MVAKAIKPLKFSQLSPDAQRLHHLVRMHQALGTASKPTVVPRAQYPHALEVSYATHLVGMIQVAREAMKPAMDKLGALLDSARTARGDADDFAPAQPKWFAGLPVMIENPAGSTRRWSDEHDNTTGETLMHYSYGYIDGIGGADGEDVDVYLGPDENAPWVYIVHQTKAPAFDEYDEDKVMLGFPSADVARAAYEGQYNNPDFFGGMTVMSLSDFKEEIAQHDRGMIAHHDRYDAANIAWRMSCWRMDAGEGSRARALIEAARLRLTDAIHPNRVDAIASKFAKQTSEWQRMQLRRQAKAALGIDVTTTDTNIPALIEHFVSENVALIKSLGNKTLDDVEKIVTRAITSGRQTEDVAKDIDERFDIGERHARMIARDQIGKLNGQISASRHRELGLRRFIWRTVGDDRVREEHEDLENESEAEPFDYDDPPDTDDGPAMPGEPILCRCTDEPVYADITDPSDEGDEDEGDDED